MSHPNKPHGPFLAGHFTVKEVAELLDIGTHTLYNWMRRNIGPPVKKFPGRLLYEETALNAWLDAQLILPHQRRLDAAPEEQVRPNIAYEKGA